ncbi:MAG: Glycine cleavage system protein [Dehalococcoidia bacterium]|nr:Glycine cleavage system protein [Dehalococcoidia bacterium]
MYPNDLRYTSEHEWVRLQSDGIAIVGITTYAQEELGDIVFVDLPGIGSRLDQFAKFGEIESVKTVSDLFLPEGRSTRQVRSAHHLPQPFPAQDEILAILLHSNNRG